MKYCTRDTEAVISITFPNGKDETVEKVAKPLFRMGEHEIFASISCEIVGKNFAGGVISHAHVVGNDVI